MADALLAEGILIHEEYDDIILSKANTKKQKVRELLAVLVRKGPDAFNAFMRALQRYHRHLFQLVKEQLMERGLPADYPEGECLMKLHSITYHELFFTDERWRQILFILHKAIIKFEKRKMEQTYEDIMRMREATHHIDWLVKLDGY